MQGGKTCPLCSPSSLHELVMAAKLALGLCLALFRELHAEPVL